MNQLKTGHSFKGIQRIVTAQDVEEGEGFIVKQAIPLPGLNQIDPFLLIHEMGPKVIQPGEAKGAPAHPHRGFETVSYILEGELEHKDSAGNSGLIFAGDVQWMTAGRGVVHSEMPSTSIQKKGGIIHGFQLWINLTKAQKMIAPKYQDTKGSALPLVKIKGGSVKVISGKYLDQASPIQTTWPVETLDVKLSPGAEFVHQIPTGWTSLAYVFEGAGLFSNTHEKVHRSQMVVFSEGGDSIIGKGDSEKGVRFLLMIGKKINEPMARYGPFVMNTNDELEKAFVDFKNGQFSETK